MTRGPHSCLAIAGILALLASGLAGVLVAPPARGFGEQVFEKNVVIGGGDPSFTIWSGQSVAQSFTATGTYVLLNLTLRMKNSGSTTDSINITIQPDAAGLPSGTILAGSDPVAGGSIGTVNVPLTPTPALTSGAVYWIIATKSGGQPEGYSWYHSGADVYPGGKAMVSGGSSWVDPATPTDMYFVTYGRSLEANVTVRLTASPPRVLVKDLVTLTIFFNNTGDQAAPRVWLNVTVPAGLSYVSDTAGAIPSTTPFPAYTFDTVANGVHSFTITTKVDVGVPPGSTLTAIAALSFTNSTGGFGPASSHSASVLVGLQGKELYLLPTSPPGLTPVPPTGGSGSRVTYRINQGSSGLDFDLSPPLARDFRALSVIATLYLDSASNNVEDLAVNLTLMDDSGTPTAVAYEQLVVTTNSVSDYQKFTFPFPSMDRTFVAGHRILLRVRIPTSSTDDADLAVNSTSTPSRLDFVTPTYVAFDSIELRDARGPATAWSPKDALRVRVTVSDPFGSGEIMGAWWNLTDPSGSLVVTFAPMTLIATDGSSPSAWKRFEASYGPPLTLGTYRVEVVAFERNGATSFIAGDAVVRTPSFTLQLSPTQSSALGGDLLFYQVWYNNSGSGPAGHVWINATLPAEVTFVTSSSEGSRNGPTNWTFLNTTVGGHLLLIEVRVQAGIPPGPYFRTSVTLNWTDEKEYSGGGLSATADVALGGPVISISLTPALSAIHQREAFVITVDLADSGDSAGTLWVNVTLPAGLLYVSDSSGSLGGTSTPTPSGVNARLPGMPPGASWSFDVAVRSGASLWRGTRLNTTAALAYTNAHGGMMPTGSATGSVVVIAPLIVNATIGLGRTVAVPGDIVPMTVEFENVGDEAAPDVWVNLTLDLRYAFVSASMAVTVQGGIIRFHLSPVGLVKTRVFLNVSVVPAAPDAAVLGITGAIDYTDALDNPLPRALFARVNVTVTAPRFTLDVSPALATMEAGTSAVFTVTPANEGTGIAGDVWLNTTLPSDLEYVSDTSDGQRMVLGSDLVWQWQSLGPGPRPFTLVLSARSTTADQSSADVRLQVQYTDTNGNRRADLVATPRVTFVAPMIQLTLLVSQESAPAGTTFFYTLRARNSGTTTARTLWLLDSLSAQLSLFSYTSSVPATGSSTLNWTFRSLRPGEEQAITLFVRIAQDASPGTAIPNEIEAVFTNSEGTVIGYSQSLAVTVTVVEPQSPLPYIIGAVVAGLAPVLFFVYRWSRSRIEQVFLVTKDGILIDHFSRSLVKDQDGDVLSAMLTAVQQFVKDAFRLGQNRALEEMKFGDFLFLVERGQFVYLAVVTAGGKPPGIARKLRRVLNELEAAYGPVFQTWNGEMEHMLGAKDLIRRRLLWERRSPAKPG